MHRRIDRGTKRGKIAPKSSRAKLTLAISTAHLGVNARVWHADAYDALRQLDPASVSLVVSSPPYCMGKEYDRSHSPNDFVAQHELLFPLLVRALRPGGSICWQVGHHVRQGQVIPLDALVYGVAAKFPALVLRNRIIWTFNHGVNCAKRFSGRHETILWYTKGEDYTFNLDPVRVPQRYPGKRHYKGPHKGEWSGHPLGKNPGDVWDIPNVKARHVEKTEHPCQFPTALVQRLVLALTSAGETVLDPFMGSGTSCIAALLTGRNFVGSELERKYLAIARRRIADLTAGVALIRPDVPIRTPKINEAVSIAPPHFATNIAV
jgi:adenine-specific DNA-methyltransferase